MKIFDNLEMHDAIKCPPEKAGYYYVLTDLHDLHMLGYTPEGGWNTHYDSFYDGHKRIKVLYNDHAFKPGAVLAWCHKDTYENALLVKGGEAE